MINKANIPYHPTTAAPIDIDYTSNDDIQDRISDYRAQITTARMISGLSFPAACKLLFGGSNLTQSQLAERADVNISTVQSYLIDSCQKRPTLNTAIAICIGMQLPPIISTQLIACAGYILGASEVDILYQIILSEYYDHKICYANQLLIEKGHPPLTREISKK